MNRQELALMRCPIHPQYDGYTQLPTDCSYCREVRDLWIDWAYQHRIEPFDDLHDAEWQEKKVDRQKERQTQSDETPSTE